ncbi:MULTISPECIES: DUF2802 domain-containing protein [unclassified Vibrio]|uniref:DUF2802 domain-containing protein n=1 Tax=unclassified Vibrio TaxID=2614977 RepID=UPI001372C476|nr:MULTISPECIES: DUF2802 domain-containing protein [unclassified Vibrio]NAW68741.1 DUF2802 domain-containing protein [Vibrio sp. V28_P6S34P95]NAX04566.1 DUF2802 domain-containing protein [Vibrio sp. V30_P3S12P165]NAX33911.1 DUF2802 domain-containing protein [Vibrio sp. V29_P1S30P107]NAX38776.1 DUF2802 domain-containing protein [Vibrio sp. V27_P1S3P104]NAX40997.1 DUF2802 domain-containing protein [Vibrio sp. V26_P1S5P106]
MGDFFDLTPPVLAGGGLLVALLLIFCLVALHRKLIRQADYFRQQARSLDKSLQKSTKQLLEIRSAAIGLGQRVTEQQEMIAHLSERLKQLENADTDARLYSRASKMAKLGADINELIEECELPKAEAELMLSLQKKLTGKEAVPPLTSDPDRKQPYPTGKKR